MSVTTTVGKYAAKPEAKSTSRHQKPASIIGASDTPLSRSLRDELLEILEVDDYSLAQLQKLYRDTFSATEVKAAVDTLLEQGRLDWFPQRTNGRRGRIISLPMHSSGRAR